METTALGLTLFLTLDVVASIALAVWLGTHGDAGASDWDRQPQSRKGAASCAR